MSTIWLLHVISCTIYYCIIIFCTDYIRDTIVPLFHKFFDQSFSHQDGCFKAVAHRIGKFVICFKVCLSVCLSVVSSMFGCILP